MMSVLGLVHAPQVQSTLMALRTRRATSATSEPDPLEALAVDMMTAYHGSPQTRADLTPEWLSAAEVALERLAVKQAALVEASTSLGQWSRSRGGDRLRHVLRAYEAIQHGKVA